MSVKAIIAIIVGGLVGVLGFALILVFGAQVGGNSALYGNLPATNITKITTNVGNGVVSGSSFFSLIFLAAAGAIALALVSLIFIAVRHFSAGGDD